MASKKQQHSLFLAAEGGDKSAVESFPSSDGEAGVFRKIDRCTGAKRRKSYIPKRFVPDAGTSTVHDDISSLNCNLLAMQNGVPSQNRNQTPIQNGDSCRIVEILKMNSLVSFTTIDNTNEDRLIFTAKRANGKEIMVDDKFLKDVYSDLLLNFYENKFHEMESP